ncbi:MAG: AAA family ATPase [Ezakiella sp.]|nr:AAA family ATPase [Ezakiella sp.]
MKIKKLILNEFGAIKSSAIDFDPGINLISAPNESGKTTSRKAIEAALYGFTNTDSRIKNFTNDYEVYKGGYYSVILEIIDDNEYFIIERNLNNNDIRVLDTNNRDITNSFRSINKIIVPGQDIFGVSSQIYAEFVDIDTFSKTNSDIANIMLNLKANNNLFKEASDLASIKMNDIGVIKYSNKKRGMLNNQIHELKIKIATLEDSIKETSLLREKLDIIKDNKADEPKDYKVIKSIFFSLIGGLLGYIIPIDIFNEFMRAGIFALVFFIFSYSILKSSVKSHSERREEDEDEKADLIKNAISQIDANTDSLVCMKDELIKLEANLAEIEHEYLILENSRYILNLAADYVKEEPVNNIMDRAGENYSKIIGKNELLVSPDLNVYLRKDRILNASKISKGTKEVIDFSIKLAFNELFIAKKFFIVDDAFSFVDDNRLSNIAKLLGDLQEDGYQIIIFSSNNRINMALKSNNIVFKNLNLND